MKTMSSKTFMVSLTVDARDFRLCDNRVPYRERHRKDCDAQVSRF
jgi:hypothetical protein